MFLLYVLKYLKNTTTTRNVTTIQELAAAITGREFLDIILRRSVLSTTKKTDVTFSGTKP